MIDLLYLALTLFAWLSTRNSRDGTAVFGFKANEYRAEGSPEKPNAVWVGYLTRDEVNDACKKLRDVQERTDAAVAQVRNDGNYKGPADFGTKVHKISFARLGIVDADSLGPAPSGSLWSRSDRDKDSVVVRERGFRSATRTCQNPRAPDIFRHAARSR